MEDHRSSAFPELTRSVLRDLPAVFGTDRAQPFVFPSTGTGMWEAAIQNTLSPGDRVLACRYGQFGHLFAECARRLGLDVQLLDLPWGEGASAERIEEALRADRDRRIRAVLVAHNETSTGVTSDIAAVRRALDVAKHPALLFVDAVSSLASIDFGMDAWGVDIAIAGTQKGFMCPAGLGLLCASERAIAAGKTAGFGRYYFDFGEMMKSNATGYFPYTPALSLLFGLREALDMLLEEGLPAVYARHARLAEGVRRAASAWGLRLCATAPRWYSNTVSAIMVPDGASGAAVVDIAYRRYDLSLGAGLGQMAGKLFRLGHMGDLNELMLLGAIAGAEMALADAGVAMKSGSGVAAAADWYRSSAPALAARG
jgi:alanine-glyoxylate transaminase/serine-glyoxylate transaminase/serine-pyruvate transaminase